MQKTNAFSVGDLAKVTAGKLLRGSPQAKARGISIDSRSLCRGELFLAIKGNNFDGHNFLSVAIKNGASALIVSLEDKVPSSPSIPVILVRDTLLALGDIARFHRLRFKIPVIAVTGSNGKTTTKEMVAELLKVKYRVLRNEGTKNNQIGVPMTLLKLRPEHQAAVLELGTSHFGEIGYLAKMVLPFVGIITNIGPSHLQYFKSLKGVYKEKSSLLKSLDKKGAAIVNADDSFLRRINRRGYRKFTFGIKGKSDFSAGAIVRKEDRVEFLLNRRFGMEINSPAISNVYNALSAIACARLLSIDYPAIQRGLKRFRFPAGRLEIKRANRICVIDDTYNANPASLGYAVDVLKGYTSARRRILVCADMRELGKASRSWHSDFGRYVAGAGIDLLITVGGLGRYIARGAQAGGLPKPRIFHFKDAQEAAGEISKLVQANDTVLVKGSRAMGMESVVKKLLKQG